MTVKLGLTAKLYVNTGTYATPIWVEIDRAQDVTLSLEKATTDVSSRASNGWRENAATLRDASIEFTMLWSPGNEGFEAIKDAFFADNEPVEILALDGAVDEAGSEGLRATMDVSNFSRSEPLEEALTVDVTVTPAIGQAAPEWVTMPLAA